MSLNICEEIVALGCICEHIVGLRNVYVRHSIVGSLDVRIVGDHDFIKF